MSKNKLFLKDRLRALVHENLENIEIYNLDKKEWYLLNEKTYFVLKILENGIEKEDLFSLLERKYGIRRETFDGLVSRLNKLGLVSYNNSRGKIYESHIEKYPLYRLQIEITRKCNLQCIHCYNNSSPNESVELNFNSFKQLIEETYDLGLVLVLFTGGEPFFKKDFEHFLSFLYENGIDFAILTNGFLINEKWIDLLKKYKVKFVSISFDSFNNDEFKKIRGKENKHIKDLIKKLVLYQIPVRIGITVIPGINDKKDSILRTYKFLQEIGINKHNILIDLVIFQGRILETKENSKLLEKSLKNLGESFKRIENAKLPRKKDSTLKGDLNYCGIGTEMLFISADNKIFLCPLLTQEELRLGILGKDNIRKIWKEHKLLVYFREERHIKETKCINCNFLNYCKGGCKARSYIEYGKFNEIDSYLCYLYKNK